MDLFKLVGEIWIKNQEANDALDETSNKGQKTQSKLSKAFSGMGKVAAVAGKAVAAGLAAGATAMGALTVKALNLSGELEQNMGGSEAVFGEYAAKMQETAKGAFESMGLSTSDFLTTANKMGALFQGAGFDIQESADMSAEAMQRAADVASIMGIDTSAAMEAIAGAAKGNFTMMDNLGVAMNETTLAAYALEKGYKKTYDKMTQQEKIGLAMEMFMDKTAYAAGNYAKENETLAGSLGTAKAALTNFLDGSGDVDQLVTAFSNAANVIVQNITEIAPRLVSGITDIVNQVMSMLPPLLEQLLPAVIEGAISLVNGLVTAMPSVVSALMAALPALIDGFLQIFTALVTSLPQIIQPLLAALPTVITQLVNGLMQNLPALVTGAIQLVVALVAALPQIIVALVQAMPTVIMSLVKALLGAAPALVQGMKDIWNSVTTAVTSVVSGMKEKVVNLAGNIKEQMSAKFTQMKQRATQIWSGMKTAISNSVNAVKTTVSNVWNSITSIASNAFNALKSIVSTIWEGIKNAITSPVETAKNTVSGIIETIKGFFNFDISWPDIPMPHFSISPSGWKIGDLLKGSIPSLGIEWYAKAMDNPMVMTDPTIFGYNPATGSLMGGGETGSEMVGGTNAIMTMIGNAVAANSAEQNDRIVAVLYAILEAILGGNADMLRAMLADKTFKVGEREFARLVKEYA